MSYWVVNEEEGSERTDSMFPFLQVDIWSVGITCIELGKCRSSGVL
jgi:hypothetical protein